MSLKYNYLMLQSTLMVMELMSSWDIQKGVVRLNYYVAGRQLLG